MQSIINQWYNYLSTTLLHNSEKKKPLNSIRQFCLCREYVFGEGSYWHLSRGFCCNLAHELFSKRSEWDSLHYSISIDMLSRLVLYQQLTLLFSTSAHPGEQTRRITGHGLKTFHMKSISAKKKFSPSTNLWKATEDVCTSLSEVIHVILWFYLYVSSKSSYSIGRRPNKVVKWLKLLNRLPTFPLRSCLKIVQGFLVGWGKRTLQDCAWWWKYSIVSIDRQLNSLAEYVGIFRTPIASTTK